MQVKRKKLEKTRDEVLDIGEKTEQTREQKA